MDEQKLDDNSTDIWTKTVVQRYGGRHVELEDECLADFVAWYTPVNKRGGGLNEEGDVSEDELAPRTDNVPYDSAAVIGRKYRRRSAPLVIRYRCYELDDVVNYKREMVTLYLPFRNEAVEILDRNAFLGMYDEREAEIMSKRAEYESNIDIAKVIEELRQMCEDFDNADPLGAGEQLEEFVRSVLQRADRENNDDFESVANSTGISAVRQRSNVMPKQDYCRLMRSTNTGQRWIVLEAIHRLHTPNSDPIQIFFTGPAGTGKTYVLKLLMETYNRFTSQRIRRLLIHRQSGGEPCIRLSKSHSPGESARWPERCYRTTETRSSVSTWCSAETFVSYRPLTPRRFTKQRAT